MTELHILGTETTNPADNMTLDNVIDNLSETATELLCEIAQDLKEKKPENYRGIHIEHSSDSSKPFNTRDVEDLIECGIVTLHHSSSNGVVFIHCNKDVYDSLVDFGEIMEIEDMEL